VGCAAGGQRQRTFGIKKKKKKKAKGHWLWNWANFELADPGHLAKSLLALVSPAVK
jgi:hypothetical protein